MKQLLKNAGPIEEIIDRASKTLWRDVRDCAPFADGTDRPVWRVSMAPSEAHKMVLALRMEAGADAFYDWQGGLVWLRMEADPEAGLARFLLRIVSDKRSLLGPLVEAHLGRPVTIETLARTAGMSVSAFKREFRGAFAASPREWMTERRLDRARHLLARADRNVTDVSLEVGFESVSHFIHRFRRRFAVTPKQFQMSQSRQNPSRAR